MNDDHLDKETSVSAEMTPTGIKASAKSRFVAAADRLGGNIVETLNVAIEARTAEKRAVIDGRVKAIEAITAVGLERLKTDPEFAERAMHGHLGSVFAKQANKDAVVDKAVEDLRRQPPSEIDSASGGDKLDDAFINRFERYAEEATSDELREKWGRVLAAEIRKPNSFSGKVLRVIDELDPQTAKLFERLCECRLYNVIPKTLFGDLSFTESANLTSAGLIVEVGLGQIRRSNEIVDGGGVPLWFWNFDALAAALSKTETFPEIAGPNPTFQLDEGKLTLPIYVLTDVGYAISSILPDHSFKMVNQLVDKLSAAAPRSEARLYVRSLNSTEWVSTRVIPPAQSSG
ncbi:DUF2806 domain-containing protein [Mesorhizobium sp. B263B2A]|uniref:DUF2806 domain-containing protein n=1 Tax=Mesorhizobium sp. B263B2A TaxID=2876669 RepID=UPI001CD1068C|nr:DUF2806 domain-containing protein [Mesorhizobium sp. B263B2A]MCA0033528.1 DUF2806 domain-containing protein [Mesorhizobium sp. B263B2A]